MPELSVGLLSDGTLNHQARVLIDGREIWVSSVESRTYLYVLGSGPKNLVGS